MNVMREIKIEKVTLNIGVGKPGEQLDKAMKLLNNITGSKILQTKSMKRIPDWGVRPNLAIACKATIRGKSAVDLLKRLFKAINNKISFSKFDNNGNFSFGISEYIDIPGLEYDVDVGIIGMDVAVTLERPGFRIKRRRLKQRKIPLRHRISREEGIEFVQKKFGVVVER
ncbi:MAG: 50S ribosomal protein L5 [Nanoarchaeota archaeon]